MQTTKTISKIIIFYKHLCIKLTGLQRKPVKNSEQTEYKGKKIMEISVVFSKTKKKKHVVWKQDVFVVVVGIVFLALNNLNWEIP